MDALKSAGFDSIVRDRAADGTPLLGVCVGMQMLFEASEEFGYTQGLGLLGGSVKRFPDDLKIPQVGWNQVEQVRPHQLLNNDAPTPFFYFVHSFFCDAADRNDVVGITEYGIRYPTVVARGNVFGVQFHPEKSQAAGLRLLHTFATIPTTVDSKRHT
jgi:glutamine amidotransferase